MISPIIDDFTDYRVISLIHINRCNHSSIGVILMAYIEKSGIRDFRLSFLKAVACQVECSTL